MFVVNHLLSFVIALIACAALHVVALRVFPRWKLLDFPTRYGLKRSPLPYPTGILAVATFLAAFPFLFAVSDASVSLLISVVALAITSFIDDRRQTHPVIRLLIHGGIGVALFLGGVRIYSLTNPLEQLTDIPLLSLDSWTISTAMFGVLPVASGIFTVVWLMLTINALNWFDGIPGQVSALSTIAFLTIGLLSVSARVNQPELAMVAFTLAGLSAACLIFDVPPPRVVMGDTGAMFFGLLIGVLTIYSGGKVATAFLVLGVPLIDLLFVIVRRIARGKSPLRGSVSDEHLHHRLLKKGWSPRKIIALTVLLGSAFGITALFLNTFQKFIAAMVLLIIMLWLSLYSRVTAPPRTA